ncbi:Hypothetical predicted protein [Podarcis lilfordi]|uniref:Uncharacterized protein n=1 Tax=Podarcis lilfordi TaxID=74358 RepID=A0AA35KDC9_9SAUR|nr:Hypothetical predicted protein [Podarcis lilfordi]
MANGSGSMMGHPQKGAARAFAEMPWNKKNRDLHSSAVTTERNVWVIGFLKNAQVGVFLPNNGKETPLSQSCIRKRSVPGCARVAALEWRSPGRTRRSPAAAASAPRSRSAAWSAEEGERAGGGTSRLKKSVLTTKLEAKHVSAVQNEEEAQKGKNYQNGDVFGDEYRIKPVEEVKYMKNGGEDDQKIAARNQENLEKSATSHVRLKPNKELPGLVHQPRANMHISESQQEFFRMLDEKIEKGRDYCSEEEDIT